MTIIFKEILDIMKDIPDIELKQKQLEWENILDEKCIVLMSYLWALKKGSYEEVLIECLNKDTTNVLSSFVDINRTDSQIRAFAYYYRFNSLISDLVIEYGEESKVINKLVSYYIFDNKMKELKWCGTSYYYNVKLRSEQVNLFRATSNIREDNKKFERIRKCIPLNIQTLMEIFEDVSISQDERTKLFKILNKGMVAESTLFHTIVALAVGQVNGSGTSLPSYSKSLGVALYKYAHGKCSLVMKRDVHTNIVEIDGKQSTFYGMTNIKTRDLNGVNFNIDFSNVRDENMMYLNKWLLDLFEEEKNICSHGTPILDRHVVNTFPISSDEIVELSEIEFIFLLRVYRNIVNTSEPVLTLDQIFINIKKDIVTQISGMHKAMKEAEMSQEGDSTKEWNDALEGLDKVLDQINQLSTEEINDIKNKMTFLDLINWEEEKNYFDKFMEPKEDAKFFYKTEKRSKEQLTWMIIKYTLLRVQEDTLNIEDGGVK
ncbi:hypothetical protein [Clostridium sulfidigenes]|uniref:hypothetical protein n=1 Tax=Clostridium sulfidigenes TaxID=318464 RepID=UPI003F8C72B9